MKLLLDEVWPSAPAQQLRERGRDALSVVERPELLHLSDDLIVEHARRMGRVTFTENVVDFIPLANEAIARGKRFPGLLLTSNTGWPRGNPQTLGAVVRALDDFMRAHPSDHALEGRVEWLQRSTSG